MKKEILDYQREDIDLIKSHKLRALVASAPGTGKALWSSAPILTPFGWVKIKDLKVNDIVVDPDGGTATVVGVYPQGVKPIFKVTFNDGTKAYCCKEHLWLVRDRNGRNDRNGGWKTVSLDYIMDKGLKADSNSHRWSIPLTQAVEYAGVQSLTIAPYVLGALLGDGGLTTHLPSFTSADKAILDRLKYELGPELTLVNRGNRGIDFNVISTRNYNTGEREANPLTLALRELGLMNELGEEKDKKSHCKFVPTCYLKSSIENRIELLRGLMDTDGTVSKGLASYCTVSKQLAEDVMDIVRGLGGSCTVTSRIPTYHYKGEKLKGSLAYNIMIRTEFNPFHLERKAKAWNGNFRAVKSIETIEPVGDEEAVCISVNSKRNLYITDDYTVTHNTIVAIRSLVETFKVSLPALVLCPASVVENWAIEIQSWAPGVKIVIIDDMASKVPVFPSFHVIYVMSWALLDDRVTELTQVGLSSIVADECFVADTLVTTTRGDVPIQDVVIGDEVLSHDVSALVWNKVTKTYIKQSTKQLVKVIHESGEFTCTYDHKVWTKEKEYVKAKHLLGLHVRMTTGHPGTEGYTAYSQVTCLEECSLASSIGMERTVYDLEVEDAHNYFANGVLVSNCHYIKNPEAQRTMAFAELAGQLKHVLLMSGTPIVNNTAELDTIKKFIGEKPLMIRRLLEDVATFVPPKARSYLPIDLRPKHREIYDKAVNDFEKWLTEEKEKLLGEGNAEEDVARIMAVEGFAKIGYLRRLVAEYKVPAALDWIARAVRLGEPVIVFVEHQVTLTKLQAGLKRLHIRYTTIEGSTTGLQRQQAIEAFQRGEYPVFIGSKAAKEGITLTAARNLLFIERFFTAADEEQAEDRCRRIGQKYKTTIWFLHAVNTIDDRLDAIIRQKRQLVRTAIGSADILETEDSNVRTLLNTWNDVVSPPGEVTGLGLGDPLPSLPKPHLCYAVVFEGPRWKEDTAKQWCKMNGYPGRVVKHLRDKIQIELHPHGVFVPGKFDVFHISKEIKIITGTRASNQNVRKIRSMLTKQYNHG
jgi:intein/homing endonuclease